MTTWICAFAAIAGHIVVGLGFVLRWAFPWQAVVGSSLAAVAVVAFGGTYLASRRTRVAIASSFLLTFLVLLTFMVTMTSFSNQIDEGAAGDLLDDFRGVVSLIIGFYFASEGIVGAAKVVSTARNPGSTTTQIQAADRDLVAPDPPTPN